MNTAASGFPARKTNKSRLVGDRRRLWHDHLWRQRIAVVVLCMGFAALHLSPSLGSAAGVEATLGSWQTLSYEMQFTTIHAAVLKTGKVFVMAGSENIPENLPNGRLFGGIWDPKAGTLTPTRPSYDMFCSAHVFLPDGTLLIAGGTEAYPTDEYVNTGGASGIYYRGSKKASLFNPVTQEFVVVPDMAAGRWYPTLVGMGNGDVYTLSGLDEQSRVNTVPEIYTGSSTGGSWRPTPAVSSSWPLYPHLSLLRSGKLFYSGGSIDNYNVGVLSPGLLDAETSQFTPIPGLSWADRREAATVLLPPARSQKALIIGGGDPAVNNVDIIDLAATSPSYTPAPPMRTPRLHVSAVLLADGKVFITGGGRYGRGEAPVFETEIYDPVTNTMTPAADSSVPRVYHSVAMLLPDGRVATAGGQPVYGQRGELRIEVYSPPYLFKGSRPGIASATTELNYGGQATIEIRGGGKAAEKIRTLNLVRPASVTHSFDAEQRVEPMSFQRSGGKLIARVPQDRNVVPPGWYMLFAIDDKGVPSEAAWVHINNTGSGGTTTTTTTTTSSTSTTSSTTTSSTTTTTTTLPPSGSTVFADNFDRTASTNLGPNWVEVAGDASISNNATLSGLSPGEGMVRAVPAAPSADHEVQADVLTGNYSGVVARYAVPTTDTVENASLYMFRYSPLSLEWQLWRKVGSTWTLLGALPEPSPGSSYTARLRVQGSTITGYHGTTQKLQVTDTQVTAGTRGGLYYGFDGSFDNFTLRSL